MSVHYDEIANNCYAVVICLCVDFQVESIRNIILAYLTYTMKRGQKKDKSGEVLIGCENQRCSAAGSH